MTAEQMKEKFRAAAAVVCKQGMVQFPVSDTAIAIIEKVVGENPEELDFILAFDEKPSQVMEQLMVSSGLPAEKVEVLANSAQPNKTRLVQRRQSRQPRSTVFR